MLYIICVIVTAVDINIVIIPAMLFPNPVTSLLSSSLYTG